MVEPGPPTGTAGADPVGTTAMIVGTVVSALSVLTFQILAGRALGTDDFAPIGVLWTISFITYTVLMIPVEQFVTRKLIVSSGFASSLRPDRWLLAATLAGAVISGTLFVALTIDQFFEGNRAFVFVAVTLLVTRSFLALGRGFLAGRRRFLAYGGTLAAEGLALVTIAVGVRVVEPSTTSFAMAMALAPLVVFAFAPFRRVPEKGSVLEEGITSTSFLGFLVLATAASQLVIAGAPIVVGLIGGGAAVVSIVFVTFTLFRGPVSSAYNLAARVLPDFTLLADRGHERTLTSWARRITFGGVALAAVGGTAAYLIGPWLIETLYGAEFRPDAELAALVGAGVGTGLDVLFVTHIYVGSALTATLAARWAVAVAAATVAVLFGTGSPALRVAIGFLVGETTALLLLGLLPLRRGEHSSKDR